jgi:hypothetical protein
MGIREIRREEKQERESDENSKGWDIERVNRRQSSLLYLFRFPFIAS